MIITLTTEEIEAACEAFVEKIVNKYGIQGNVIDVELKQRHDKNAGITARVCVLIPEASPPKK